MTWNQSLKFARNWVGDGIIEAMTRHPALEPWVIRSGQLIHKVPWLGTLYRHVRLGLARNTALIRSIEIGPHQLWFDVSHFTASSAYFLGSPYEPDVTAHLFSVLAPGDVFVDVGANVGYFTVLAALKVGSAGRVIAFEPNPALLPRLRQHLAMNHLEDRVQIETCALSSQSADAVPFYISPDRQNDGLSSLLLRDVLRAGERVEISTSTFDDWIDRARPSRIDLVKIDVECAEHEVVSGMRRTFEKMPPRSIVCETSIGSAADLMLIEVGYQRLNSAQSSEVRNLVYAWPQATRSK